jgi:signal transduction histidine kinase/CheY-like chemotaxis protein/ABC-type amino acid transport substrate-binding protein/HPt (histidine-containing phosphotransfer) domain-containing protein
MQNFTLRTILFAIILALSVSVKADHGEDDQTIKVGLPTIESFERSIGYSIKEYRNLKNVISTYWTWFGEEFGYHIEIEEASYDALFKKFQHNQIDVIALDFSPNLAPDFGLQTLSFAKLNMKLYKNKRYHVQEETANVWLLAPKGMSPPYISANTNVKYHGVHFDNINSIIENADYIWSPVSIDSVHSSFNIDLSNFSLVNKKENAFSLRARVSKENRKLYQQINRSIWTLDSFEAKRIWQSGFQYSSQLITSSLGSHTRSLTYSQIDALSLRNKLKIGYLKSGVEPFYINQGFYTSGFLHDVNYAVLEQLGLDFEIVMFDTFSNAMKALMNNDIDLFNGVTPSEKREKAFWFTELITNGEIGMVSSDELGELGELSSMQGKSIALVNGFIVNQTILEDYPALNPIWVDSVTDAMDELEKGNVDLYIGGYLSTAYKAHKELPNTFKVTRLDRFPIKGGMAIAGDVNDKLLAAVVQNVLSEIGWVGLENIKLKWDTLAHRNSSINPEKTVVYKSDTLISTLYVYGIFSCILVILLQFVQNKQSKRKLKKMGSVTQDLESKQHQQDDFIKAKSDFLARMSHEIRTPMNGVLGLVDMINKTDLTSEQSSILKDINFSAKNLMSILNDVLDYSKFNAGKMELNFDVANLKTRAFQSVANYSHIANEKGVDLNINVDSSINDYYHLDSTRMMQVLNNILSNAVKFTSEGFVSVNILHVARTEKDKQLWDAIRINIRDSGIGLTKESIEKLAKPFEQVDSGISRKFGGTGLGLAIVHEITELMGGKLSICSVPDKGSKFSIQLMLQVSESQSDYIVDDPDESEVKNLNGHSVLFAEDNPINQKVIAAQLHSLGLDVTLANDGRHALELIKNNHFDLLLSDLHMPNLDGYELVREIRTNSQLHDIPAIAFTADVTSEVINNTQSAGFDDYLSKPCSENQLYSTLVKFLSASLYVDSQETYDDIFEEIQFDSAISTERGDNNSDSVLSGTESDKELVDNNVCWEAPKVQPESFNFEYLLDLCGDVEIATEVIEDFIHQCPEDKESMNAAYKTHDLNRLSKIAHKIKGSFLYFGMHGAADRAKELETHVKELDDMQIDELVDTTLLFMDDLVAQLEAHLAKQIEGVL